MSKKHMVMCRICKDRFDAQEDKKDIEWVMPSRNWYYHKSCYDTWKSNEHNKSNDLDWIDLIYDLIARDLKGSYNWNMIEAQRKKIISQKMTNKGIYYSLYWYFIIKNNKWNKDYGIGIVPHIYKEATNFWADKIQKNHAIARQIEKLATDRQNETIKIKKKGRKKKYIQPPEDL